MAFDDNDPRIEHVLDQEAEGVDSAPRAEVRRQASFGDADMSDDSVEVDTSRKGSFGQVDPTPGTEGDSPTGGIVDPTQVGGTQGSSADVAPTLPVDKSTGAVDVSEKGSYGELEEPLERDLAEDDTQRHTRYG